MLSSSQALWWAREGNNSGSCVQDGTFCVTSGRGDRPPRKLSEMGTDLPHAKRLWKEEGFTQTPQQPANTLVGELRARGVQHTPSSRPLLHPPMCPAGEADHGGGCYPKVRPRGQQPHHLLLR